MKPIIHIGFPKTGTTWFQREFYPYVLHRKYLDHNKIFGPYVFNISPFDYCYSSELLKIFRDPSVIICDEGLIGSNPYVSKEMLYRVKKIFENSSIILFIRNQEDMLVSKYSQYVLGAYGTQSAPRYFSWDPGWSRLQNFQKFHYDYLKYDVIINYLHHIFGEDDVYVYLFEDFSENPKEFLRQFSKEHGLDISLEGINFSPNNTGMRRKLIPFVRFLNIFTRYKIRDKYFIIHIPRWHLFAKTVYTYLNKFKIFGSKPTLKQLVGNEKYNSILNEFRKSNANIVDRFSREKLIKHKYPL
ncbi:MAG: hypothetical protein PHD06_03215 [Bacteroidales bacterium]|mgnify:CR=1 FL=1|jgi:hypothetical protein|nr:hypothetical protein [Bacteroidales bacterium]MDY0197794.1 hypothetical protein [Tenuifilaceae bacterium]